MLRGSLLSREFEPARVLHVVASLSPQDGGSTTAVIETVRSLQTRGLQVRVVATDADGDIGRLPLPLGEWHEHEGVVARFESRNRPHRLKASWRLGWTLLRSVHEFELVHIHGYYLFHVLAAAMVCRLRHVPYIVQPHGSFEPYHHEHTYRLKRIWDLTVGCAIIRGSAGLLFTSETERDASAVHAQYAYVAPLGANHGVPAGVREQSMSLWVLFLGRLTRKKNPDRLLLAWPAVYTALPKARLVFAGPDEDITNRDLRALANALDCSSSVSFLGPVEPAERLALMEACDLFVLPSENENFSLAAAEALAAGLPSLLSSEIAIAPTAESRGACVLLDSGPDAGLAQQILDLLRDPNRRADLSAASRRFVSQQLSWDMSADAISRAYAEVLERSTL